MSETPNPKSFTQEEVAKLLLLFVRKNKHVDPVIPQNTNMIGIATMLKELAVNFEPFSIEFSDLIVNYLLENDITCWSDYKTTLSLVELSKHGTTASMEKPLRYVSTTG